MSFGLDGGKKEGEKEGSAVGFSEGRQLGSKLGVSSGGQVSPTLLGLRVFFGFNEGSIVGFLVFGSLVGFILGQ